MVEWTAGGVYSTLEGPMYTCKGSRLSHRGPDAEKKDNIRMGW